MNLAVAVCACDKYSFVWNGWYQHFKKNWDINCNVYFLNEEKDIDFPDIQQIKVNIPDVSIWTKRVRESIKQIPEDNIFFLLDDLFFIEKFEKKEFERIFNAFEILKADALRVKDIAKYYTVHDTEFYVNDINLKKFDPYSDYLISYSPNIWKKSFMLECIKHDEDPWISEVGRSASMKGGNYNIYIYEKLNWFANVLKRGKTSVIGQKLLNAVK